MLNYLYVKDISFLFYDVPTKSNKALNESLKSLRR